MKFEEALQELRKGKKIKRPFMKDIYALEPYMIVINEKEMKFGFNNKWDAKHNHPKCWQCDQPVVFPSFILIDHVMAEDWEVVE